MDGDHPRLLGKPGYLFSILKEADGHDDGRIFLPGDVHGDLGLRAGAMLEGASFEGRPEGLTGFARKVILEWRAGPRALGTAHAQDLLGVPRAKWVNLIDEVKRLDPPTALLLETIFSVLRDEYIELKVTEEANRVAPALKTILKTSPHLSVLKANLVLIAQELHVRQDRITPVKDSI